MIKTKNNLVFTKSENEIKNHMSYFFLTKMKPDAANRKKARRNTLTGTREVSSSQVLMS